MTTKKIVLAYEGSEGAKKALDWAVEFANEHACELHVVTVLESTGLVSLEPNYQVIEMDQLREQFLRQINDQAKMLCDGLRCTVRTKVVAGNAAEELMLYAKAVQADMIVCGTRGMGGFVPLLLGSVAHKLVTYAKCPVLVVK